MASAAPTARPAASAEADSSKRSQPAAVASDPEPDPEPPEWKVPERVEHGMLRGLKDGAFQNNALCTRKHQDLLSKRLCRHLSSIKSLVDLQRAVGVDFKAPRSDKRSSNADNGNPAFVFMGHSQALSPRLVSSVNPRALIFTPAADTGRSGHKPLGNEIANPDFVAMAFVRGEQFVELISRDPLKGDLRFFLVRFKQACNEAASGCSAHDLFSPAIESSWKSIVVYDDRDLENTAADCNICHQPGGYDTSRILIMQSLRTPWTHFFRRNRRGGKKNLAQYYSAHDKSERYAGIPGSEIFWSDPAQLQGFVENEGFAKQRDPFNSEIIARQADEHEGKPHRSPHWWNMYVKSVKGNALPPAYPIVGPFDAKHIAKVADNYRQATSGTLPTDKMVPLIDLFAPDVLHLLGQRPKPKLDAKGAAATHVPSLSQSDARSFGEPCVVRCRQLPRDGPPRERRGDRAAHPARRIRPPHAAAAFWALGRAGDRDPDGVLEEVISVRHATVRLWRLSER